LISSLLTFSFQKVGFALSCASPSSQIIQKISESKIDKNKVIFKGSINVPAGFKDNGSCDDDYQKGVSGIVKKILDFFPFVNSSNIMERACEKSDGSGGFVAHLNGNIFSSVGFKKPISDVIRINETCFNDWGCGSVPLDQDVIGFLEYSNNSFSVTYGVCDAWIFKATKNNTNEVIKCLTNKECKSSNFDLQ
jgi:hypothetical protein